MRGGPIHNNKIPMLLIDKRNFFQDTIYNFIFIPIMNKIAEKDYLK
jgi:hypothetical protein